MNDSEIDRLMRLARPTPPTELSAAGQELLEEIVSTQPGESFETSYFLVHEVIPVPGEERGRRHRRWLVGVAAAVTIVLAVALPMIVFDRGEVRVAPATGLSRETLSKAVTPYLGMDNPEWPLTDLDEVGDKDSGYQTFSRSPKTSLQVIWDVMENYDDVYDIEIAQAKHSQMKLFGAEAEFFDRGSGRFDAMVQPDLKHYVWIRGRGMKDRKAFLQAVADLRPVDEKAWSDGLPGGTVQPQDTVAVAQQMLSDVPRPPGTVDHKKYRLNAAVSYDIFAMMVTQPPICQWLQKYQDAYHSSDQKRMVEVAEVLQGSRDWEVLKNMSKSSDWPTKLWKYADRASERLSIRDTTNPFAC